MRFNIFFQQYNKKNKIIHSSSIVSISTRLSNIPMYRLYINYVSQHLKKHIKLKPMYKIDKFTEQLRKISRRSQ